FGDPAQPTNAGREAVLAAARNDERRHLLEPAPDGLTGNREDSVAIRSTNEWILLLRRTDEDAVVQPLGLDELELALQMRAGEHKDDAAVCAVILEHAVRECRAVAGATPDHPVQADVHAPLGIKRVPGVGAPSVRT